MAFVNIFQSFYKMFGTHVQYALSTDGDLTPHVDSLAYNSIYILIKAFSQGCTISLQVLMCTFIFILTESISQCSQPCRQHTGRDPILRALANVLSAGDVQSSGGEEGIVGSLNTVLLCGCIPKCFCVCARGRCTILIYSRPHTPEVAPRLLCLFQQLTKLGMR